MPLLPSLARRLKRAFSGKPRHPLASLIRLDDFQSAIGYSIVRYDLFHEALSHRSYSRSTRGSGLESNERLEFLGDAVLNLAVAEYLFAALGMAAEGEMTKVRARLVNRKALALCAGKVGLEHYLLTSAQTEGLRGRGLETILSDAYEAVVGAIYLDGGYEEARAFITRTVIRTFQEGEIGSLDDNFKSLLLEHAQAEGLGTPRYVTVGERGPDHDRTFTIAVQLGREQFKPGSGKNKKDAEQEAARSALRKLGVIG